MLSTLLGFINLSYFLVKQCHMQLVGMDFISSLKFLSNWEFGGRASFNLGQVFCLLIIDHETPHSFISQNQCAQGQYPKCYFSLIFPPRSWQKKLMTFYGAELGQKRRGRTFEWSQHKHISVYTRNAIKAVWEHFMSHFIQIKTKNILKWTSKLGLAHSN